MNDTTNKESKMAQFRGTVEGTTQTVASRLGSKKTGLTTTCNGWSIGVRCVAVHVDGVDYIRVFRTSGNCDLSDSELIAEIVSQ